MTSTTLRQQCESTQRTETRIQATSATSARLIPYTTVKMVEIEMPDPEDLGGNVTKPFKFVTGRENHNCTRVGARLLTRDSWL